MLDRNLNKCCYYCRAYGHTTHFHHLIQRKRLYLIVNTGADSKEGDTSHPPSNSELGPPATTPHTFQTCPLTDSPPRSSSGNSSIFRNCFPIFLWNRTRRGTLSASVGQQPVSFCTCKYTSVSPGCAGCPTACTQQQW